MSLRRIGIALLIIIVAASGVVAWERLTVEQSNRTVEIAVDVSFLYGVDPKTLAPVFPHEGSIAGIIDRLRKLKEIGVTTIAVPMGDTALYPMHEYCYDVALLAQEQGLLVSPRLDNPTFMNTALFLSTLEWVSEWNLGTVIFSGEEIYGYRDFVARLAREFRQREITPGIIEFANQRGAEDLARLLDYEVVRVHGIKDKELAAMDEEKAVKRFLRAVRERNLRVLYVRPFALNTWEQNLSYVASVAEGLVSDGYMLGKAEPFSEVGFWNNKAVILRQALALLAALVFPVAGVLSALRLLDRLDVTPRNREWTLTSKAFWCSSLLSLVGALAVTALLSERSFMLTIHRFRGVKVMHVFPVILVAIIYVILYRGLQWHLLPISLRLDSRARQLAAGIIGLIVVAAFGFMVIRTGNYGGIVPHWETAFRDFLEEALWARPRTKEFLFGHPLLFLGLFLFKTQGKRNPIPFFLISFGIIGQASMINTFAHIHSPLVVSAVRTIHGLVLGWMLGSFGVALVHFLENWASGTGWRRTA